MTEAAIKIIVGALAVRPLVLAALKPPAEEIGMGLRDIVKEVFEHKKVRRSQNLQEHIEKVRERITTRVAQMPSFLEKKQTLSQLELFADLAEAVQDIDPAETELSQIWQDLMARVALGEDISPDLIHTLKTLSAGEARLLLKLRNKRTLGLFSFPAFQKLSKNELFHARALVNKQLLERSYVFFTVLILVVCSGLICAGYYLYVAKSWHWVALSAKSERRQLVLEYLAIPTCVAAVLLFQARHFIKWQLSWVGKDLTGFTDNAGKKS